MMHRLVGLLALTAALIGPAQALDIQATTVPGRAPSVLSNGEIAINRADKRLIFKNVDGSLGFGSLLNALPAGRKAVEQGDGTDLFARPSGGTQALPLATWFGLQSYVTASGASGDGSDQTARIKAAIAAKGSGLLRWPQGAYNSDGTVPYAGLNVAFEMDAPTLTGGYLANVQNPDVANRAVKLFTVPFGSRFAHGLTLQGSNPASPAGMPSYERTLGYWRYEQGDPSTYGAGGAYHDLVGLDLQGSIRPGVTAGRVWGLTTTMTVPSTADGYVLNIEGGVHNDGSYQPWPYQPTTKSGVQMAAGGANDSTAAYTAISGGAKWNIGYYADTNALRGYYAFLDSGFSHLPLYAVDRVGATTMQTLAVAGGKQTLGSTSGGVPLSGKIVLRAVSTGGASVRLLSDGASTPSSSNTLNIPDYWTANVSIRLGARNASLGSVDVAWTLPIGLLRRANGAASTTWTGGTPVSVTNNAGATSAITVTAAADTTNGGLALTFAPPAGNTDQWSVWATVEASEGQ